MPDPTTNPSQTRPDRRDTPTQRPDDPFAPSGERRDDRMGKPTTNPDDPKTGRQHDRMDDESGQNQPQRPGQQPRRDEP